MGGAVWDLDYIFSYKTAKLVEIRDKRLGLLQQEFRAKRSFSGVAG
eukprot:gene3020-17810_t